MLSFRQKGISLMEILIVIVVIVILSTVTTLSISGISAKAEAKRIMNNLQLLRTAALVWCKENSEKLRYEEGGKTYYDGRIKIGTMKAAPIQEFNDNLVGISRYVKANEIIHVHNPPGDGEYGVNAAKDKNGTRWAWYVGYHFQNGEEDVKKELKELAQKLIDNGDCLFTEKYPTSTKMEIGPYFWMKVFYDKEVYL